VYCSALGVTPDYSCLAILYQSQARASIKKQKTKSSERWLAVLDLPDKLVAWRAWHAHNEASSFDRGVETFSMQLSEDVKKYSVYTY
jgi:hypothetical protein